MATTSDQRAGVVESALASAGSGDDLESVTRPLLTALQELTGLSSTYLTSIDWKTNVQRIVYARNTGTIEIPEGLEVEWSDTLCRRALESGSVCTDDVPAVWGDSDAARELGIRTYVSSPVQLPDGAIVGTLCGASDEQVPVDGHTADLLRVFSRIVADAIARERALRETEARALEAEERLRARARFLAMAEHQLKTPLAVVAGWARLLQAGRLQQQDVTAAIDAIVEQSDRLRQQVDELLDEATAQVVVSELSRHPVELAPFVTEMASTLQALSDDHPIEVDLPRDLRATFDRRALRIVLEHLVENAVKYSPEGGAIVIGGGGGEDGRVALTVRDHGPGLPDGVDVFAAFVRGDGPQVPGTGLGLHIVHTLLSAMDGEVSAHPAGPGTVFRLDLPGG